MRYSLRKLNWGSIRYRMSQASSRTGSVLSRVFLDLLRMCKDWLFGLFIVCLL